MLYDTNIYYLHHFIWSVVFSYAIKQTGHFLVCQSESMFLISKMYILLEAIFVSLLFVGQYPLFLPF